MHNAPLRRALAVVAGLTLGAAATASAATITVQPSAGNARTFATTQGSWTSSVDYGGVCVIPGVTCPLGTAGYQPSGGSGGARDGDLRASVQTVAGLLSNVTIAWASPSFVAPAETDQATLAVSVRPQVASLLGIGAAVRLDAVLSDLDVPASSTTIARVPITTASASFAQLQLSVPPGALTPGHRYAIELRTVVNAPVSVAQSGFVDIDDVSLTMADLLPPSGLTASVPGSGALRVEGQVDPQGQSTSVSVQYGPTATYGSSTAPVSVSGAGAQSFAIPLAGLDAGTTYHYRVVATNGDGTLTTTDAAFVAPTPPSDAPPLVTGAGNSRSRSVVYDRGPDVTSASVELLDGLGGVLSSVPDLDGDGQVNVTLPDADGDYGIRVLRTNAAAQTTRSSTVTATLDRVAPSTAGLGLTVLPVLSSDRLRAVAFTLPPDAVGASAQVIGASDAPVGPPVLAAGGMAAVQLGASDGDYRVALTLSDAAGNTATLVSGVVTLDATAPGAGGAPDVTGAGNARSRTVSFDRDLTTITATIEVLDGDGNVVDSTSVLVGASGGVTLPDTDGTYMVRVRQDDLLGNQSTSAATPAVLDRVPPDAGAAPTVAGSLRSRQRDVTFSRALDATSATVELRDGRGAVVLRQDVASGNAATIALPDLDGDYDVRVVQTDWAGNAASSPDAGALLDRVAPATGPAPTVTGALAARTRHVAFTRDPATVLATIELLDARGVVVGSQSATGAAGDVTLPDLDGVYSVRVVQADAAGNAATTPTTATLLARLPTLPREPVTPRPPSAVPPGGTGPTGGGSGGSGGSALTDPARFGALLAQCYGSGDVAVVDVRRVGRRVLVQGLTRYGSGTPVAVLDEHGRTVGSTSTDARGRFVTVVASPSASRRAHTLYRAVVGATRSGLLRLQRSNAIRAVAVRGTTVTVSGRVDVRALGRRPRIAVLGGRGGSACRRPRALQRIGGVRVNPRTGAYVVHARIPSGSGMVAVSTRAAGKRVSHSAFALR